MKKILIFNGYYYPSQKCGGPITSIENIVNACYKEFDFYLVCYNHDFGENKEFDIETNKWIKVGNAQVMYVKDGDLDFSRKYMKKLFTELKPDLIWFSGVLTPNNKIVSVINAKKMNIPVLFSPRGEVSADRIKLKAYKKVPYLNFLKIFGVYNNCYFHGTSDDEIEGIRKYFSPSDDHIFKIANIGITKQEDIINLEKKKGELKVFFFSRIHEVKNLLFAIKCINNCKARITFDIYGPIESIEYWNECLEEINKSPINVKINYKGILNHNNMSIEIQSHDCFLFPTLNENYGHVIAESLANSRPVILSKGTTPWDDLEEKAGFVIDLEEKEKFSTRLDFLANLNQEDFEKLVMNTRKYFLEKISKDNAIEGHIDMIKEITKDDKDKNR